MQPATRSSIPKALGVKGLIRLTVFPALCLSFSLKVEPYGTCGTVRSYRCGNSGKLSFISSDRLAFRHCPAAHLTETAAQLQKSTLSSVILHKEAKAQMQEFIDTERCRHSEKYLILIADTQHSMVKVLLEGHAEAHITRFQPVMPAHITLYASTAEISFSIPFFSRSHPHGSGVLQGRRK
ncbi:hypothetical protein QQF64_015478 [Cirrhinus molitorella]|uniref:Uncharacterized protein n=1 Tax=Cirrhinus molitorella TaxID=172907 RepID=A0ABR3NV07_9TELE